MGYQDYVRHGANLGGAAGAAGGAAGGNILSRALGGVVDALDAPRQAITNLGRSGYRALTGEGGWDDALSALPGAAGGLVSGGLIASGAGAPLGILAGSLLGGATQIGMKAADEGRTDEEGNPLGNRFEAASTDDLARGMGFDPDEDLLGKAASFGLGMATDPLSYTGGALGKALGAKAGGKLGEEVAWRGIQNRRTANLGEDAVQRMGQGMEWLPGAGAAPTPTPLRSILADDFGDVMRNSPSSAPEGAMRFSDVLQGKVQFPRSSPNSTMGDWAAPFVDSKMPTRPAGPGIQEGSFKFADDAPTRAGGGAGPGGFIDFGAPAQGGSMADIADAGFDLNPTIPRPLLMNAMQGGRPTQQIPPHQMLMQLIGRR